MTTTTHRLAYEDADAAETMWQDAAAAGDRLGVGRTARLDRGARTVTARRTPAGKGPTGVLVSR